MMNLSQTSIYGPVESWRLGKSLGVDLLCVDSICSFECVYCQLGKINVLTDTRGVFVSTEKVLEDLKKSDWRSADVITFSGSGEPTLAANLGDVIKAIKDFTCKPIVVLTNSSLLYDPQVRNELNQADKIFCKLDAWSSETLSRFDRPADGVTLEKIITGIGHLRNEFNGFLAIQTMLLRVPKEFEIEELGDIFRLIKPDEVQLNLPSRPIPKEFMPEGRGNDAIDTHSHTHLKTISRIDLERVRRKLSELTHVKIITR